QKELSEERVLRDSLEEHNDSLTKEVEMSNQEIETQRQVHNEIEDRFEKLKGRIKELEKKKAQLEQDRSLEKRVLGNEIQHLRAMNQKLEKVVLQKDLETQTKGRDNLRHY